MLSIVTMAIYSFHMPLFMALSGAVFAIQLRKGKYGDWKKFVAKKADRLLYPFLMVTIFWCYPLKYLSGYWGYSDNIFYDVIMGQVFIQGNTHLWFLPTLFVEFILFWMCFKYTRIYCYKMQFLFVLVFFHFLSLKIEIKIISYTLCFAVYFYAGGLFDEMRQRINAMMTNRYTFFLCVVWGAVLCYDVMGGISLKIVHHILVLITAFLGMLAFYAVCYQIMCRNILHDFIEFFAKKSMGIYLYSDPLNYLFMSIYVGFFGIYCLGNEWHAGIIYLLRFLVTFLISLWMMNCLEKIKIKYNSLR